MGLQIEAISDPTCREFREAVRIYRQTIPKPQRDPDWYLAERIGDPDPHAPFHLLIAKEDDRCAGYAAGEYLTDMNLGFLAYLGTDPAVRGRGIGAALYEAMLTSFVEDALHLCNRVPDGLVLEAEKARRLATDGDAAICAKRLLFYKRLGAEPIPGINFRQPLARSHGQQEMFLLYHPIGRHMPDRYRGEAIARRLYQRLYGRRHPPDAQHQRSAPLA